MHRTVSITVPPRATDSLLDELQAIEGVVTLSVQRGESVKPPGDVVTPEVLNRDVDAVRARVDARRDGGGVSVSTAELDSLVDAEQARAIRHDVDEVSWETAETALRHHTRPTLNFFVTTALGAVVATCALVSTSRVTEATALVAAAIIAPVFEPLARLPLAVVLRRADLLGEGLRALVLSYATLIVAAILMMLVLRAGSHGFVVDYEHSTTVHEVWSHPAVNLIISAAGAVAGVVMVAAGRFTLLAGPVVALQLLPAAATLGIALALGRLDDARWALGRLGIDIGMVVVAGLLVFAYKQVRVHRRTVPLY